MSNLHFDPRWAWGTVTGAGEDGHGSVTFSMRHPGGMGTLSELLVTPDVPPADLVIDSLAVTVWWADCPGRRHRPGPRGDAGMSALAIGFPDWLPAITRPVPACGISFPGLTLPV